MSGLGDLELHLLEGGGLGDVETTSPMQIISSAKAANSKGSCGGGRSLKRAKSEAAPSSNQVGLDFGLKR